jgi:hypothetical protein
MKIIALEKEIAGKTSEDFEPFLTEEAHHLWQLYNSDVIREVYFRTDDHTAVIIMECDSLLQAKEIVAEFPLVKNELIEFELIPLKPYDGFERLFR